MIILSKLADYSVIVATHLAAHPERQETAASIAAATRLPPATVAKLLKALAHAGLVTATRGAAGGYRLARLPAAISVAQVVAAIDGIELACLLRQKFGLPAIFLSGLADADTTARAQTARPLGFLPKPFLPSQVFNAIQRALDLMGC